MSEAREFCRLHAVLGLDDTAAVGAPRMHPSSVVADVCSTNTALGAPMGSILVPGQVMAPNVFLNFVFRILWVSGL